MDANIRINVDLALTAIKCIESYMQDSKNDYERYLRNFEIIEQNVTGDAVHNHLVRIIDSLKTCSDRISLVGNEAIEQAKKQIDTYVTTYEGAKEMLDVAIAAIEEFNSNLGNRHYRW